MKVVINKCYGGFGISLDALKELVKRNASCIEKQSPKSYYGGDNEKYKGRDDWEKRWLDDFKEFTDIGDGFMADKKRAYNIYKDGLLYFTQNRSDQDFRTDKDLIDVVESMGGKANGWAAELKVVEIPDGIEWSLDDYDGIETIHENHRSW